LRTLLVISLIYNVAQQALERTDGQYDLLSVQCEM
jgi:hypothetical protein